MTDVKSGQDPREAQKAFMNSDSMGGKAFQQRDMNEAEGISDKMRPGAPKDADPDAGASPGGSTGAFGPHGGLNEFLFQFLKANPDLAREMSTRMNAVINGQKLQGLKGAAPGSGSPPGGAPLPGGPPGMAPPQPGAPPPQMGAPGGAPPAGQQPALQQMLASMKAPQG